MMMKKTELKVGKIIEISSSFFGFLKEEFFIPKKRVDHLAVRNFPRSGSALLALLLSFAAFVLGETSLSFFILIAAIFLLLVPEKRKVLFTSSGQGIKLYISEKDWEKLKRAI